MKKIEEILSETAAGISTENSQTLSSINQTRGDPDCPHCQGVGYLRTDVPVGHKDFGKVYICLCRQKYVNQKVQDELFSASHLESLQNLTFDSFKPHGRIGLLPLQASSLEQAYNQTLQFAKSPRGWLLLQGDYGCGKTHLAAAIANYSVSLGIPTLFITVPDLLDSLRFAYDSNETTFEKRFSEVRDITLLILDDFGTQNATSWAQEKLFQIINHRYINRLPLVITTNVPLEEIEERIGSRLQDPELVTKIRILAPDYRNPTDPVGYHQFSSLATLHNRTFVNFDSRQGEKGIEEHAVQSLDKAFKAAMQFAKYPQGWLVFSGPYGSGKTHLAAAIANFRAEAGFPCLFVYAPDLFDYLRATFAPNSQTSFDRRFDLIRSAPLLILDDLGTQAMTPWVREKLYQLFNHRYNSELPTVITTSESMDKVDARIRSRLLDSRLCTIYGISAPAYHSVPRKKSHRK